MGSNPIASTQFLPFPFRTWRLIGYTLGGLVAGEGSFQVAKAAQPFTDGTPMLRFVFEVTMATRDHRVLEALRRFLGHGSIRVSKRRDAHWQPTSTFTITSRSAHHAV